MREHSRFHCFLRDRGLQVNKENLVKFAEQEADYYYRFTVVAFSKHSGIPRLKKDKPIVKCKIKGCDKPKYGQGLCNKHWQGKQAKKRGYWKSGNGRTSKCLL
jgi:hypothetical protein